MTFSFLILLIRPLTYLLFRLTSTLFLPGFLPTILLLTLPKPNTCSSLKPSSCFSSFPSLYLNESPLELVSSYKYLGVFFLLISPGLCIFVIRICSKCRKLIGFLFRYFYRFSSPTVLLYLALIRPHLEHCSSVWDPSSSILLNISLSNSVLSNGLPPTPLCLIFFHCPSLSLRRKQSKHIFLYQVLNDFPPSSFCFQTPPHLSSRSYHPSNLLIPFARTSTFLYSFVPSVCRLWKE